MPDFNQSPLGITSIALPISANNFVLGSDAALSGSSSSTDVLIVDGSPLAASGSLAISSPQVPVSINPQLPLAGQLWPLGALILSPSTITPTPTPTPTPAPDPSEEPDPFFRNVRLLLKFEGSSITDSTPFSASRSFVSYGDFWTTNGKSRFGQRSLQAAPGTNYFYTDTGIPIGAVADFTFEFWFQLGTTVNLGSSFVWILYIDVPSALGVAITASGQICLTTGSTNRITHPTVVSPGVWHHIAITRKGPNVYLYFNGISAGSTYDVSGLALGGSVYRLYLGTGAYSGSLPATCFFDEFRYTAGVARYWNNFTPPSAPFGSVAYSIPPGTTGDPWRASTSLLLHFDGVNNSTAFGDSSIAGIGVTRNGSPFITTAHSPFGGSSGDFNGIDQWLSMTSADLALAGSDHTIEGWIRLRALPSVKAGFAFNGNTADDTNRIQIEINPTGTVSLYLQGGAGTGATFTSVTALTINTWYHIAYSMFGSTVYLFIDGIQEATGTYSTSIAGNNSFRVGLTRSSGTLFSVNGFIDEFRVTKGYARYISAFSRPTAVFPDT